MRRKSGYIRRSAVVAPLTSAASSVPTNARSARRRSSREELAGGGFGNGYYVGFGPGSGMVGKFDSVSPPTASEFHRIPVAVADRAIARGQVASARVAVVARRRNIDAIVADRPPIYRFAAPSAPAHLLNNADNFTPRRNRALAQPGELAPGAGRSGDAPGPPPRPSSFRVPFDKARPSANI